jgi:hypothetical protein
VLPRLEVLWRKGALQLWPEVLLSRSFVVLFITIILRALIMSKKDAPEFFYGNALKLSLTRIIKYYKLLYSEILLLYENYNK